MEDGPATVAAKARRETLIASIVNDVAELPDRTSPDDWPDAMLVTADELRNIMVARIPLLLL